MPIAASNYAIQWDQDSERLYETGIDRGVLYPKSNAGTYPAGYAWNGLTGVDESPSGADANDIYADNIKYLTLRGAEKFEYTIKSYTYPDQFAECDGSTAVATGVLATQQTRKAFGLTYRTKIGNDTDYDDHGYKLHLIYDSTASPSSKSYSTVNDSPEAIEFSWSCTTTPVSVSGFKPTAHLIIDSTKANPTKLAALEDILYGTAARSASDAVYAATSDVTPQAGKTYYTKSGNTYTAFTGATFNEGTTYYVMTSPAVTASAGTAAYLPLPDAVIAMFAA